MATKDDNTVGGTICPRVWAAMFGSRMGIRLHRSAAAKAAARCADHAELAEMIGHFSEAFPSVMTAGLDRKFLDTINSVYMKLKTDRKLRASAMPLRDATLCLSGRVGADGRLDACDDPALCAELWNSTLVYVASREAVPTALRLVSSLLAAGCSRVVCVVPCPECVDRVRDHEGVREHNVPVYAMPEGAGRDAFSEAMPKVANSFWCVTRDVSDAPCGACQSACRNCLLLDGPARELTEDERAQMAGDRKGYGRAFWMTDAREPRLFAHGGSFYSLPASDDRLRSQVLRAHQGHDGSDASSGLLAFLQMVLDVGRDCRGDDDTEKRLFVLAVDTRENPVLAACMRRSLACSGAAGALLVACSNDDIGAFYRERVPGCTVAAAPCAAPFLRAKSFSMPAYNTMLCSPEFWELVRESLPEDVTHVLMVQDDGGMFREIPRQALETYLQYDYVGAPWDERNPQHLKSLCPSLVGNGGVSLRSVEACLRVTRDPDARETRGRLLFDKFDMPEDAFFASAMHGRSDCRVAPRGLALEFSSEQVLTEGSYCLHKVWLYADQKKTTKFLSGYVT